MADPEERNPEQDGPGGPAAGRECDDFPKLTAEEWAYIQAVAEGGDD